MDFLKFKYVLIKSGIFLLLFSILHFIYEWIPIIPFAVIGGTNESVFQHLKLAFYAYLFLIPIEYLLFRKNIEHHSSFIYSRLLVTFIIPGMELILWYSVPSLVGEITPLALELIYSMIILYIMGIFGGIIEQNMYGTEFKTNIQLVIIILLGAAIYFFTIFTFTDPFLDVFAIP
ncbi:MAG: hypothetical protein HWN66_05135 [Candidatus Helarchaeota archaeon]|nr:hypothetical protein [Candidatus Helarchaeota archaeon]